MTDRPDRQPLRGARRQQFAELLAAEFRDGNTSIGRLAAEGDRHRPPRDTPATGRRRRTPPRAPHPVHNNPAHNAVAGTRRRRVPTTTDVSRPPSRTPPP
jgi:hypothetical protein